MFTLQTIVKCESGLHNKQATYFIQKANEFRANVWVEVDERRINAKSLLGVLSMAITSGTVVTLIADGPDEETAVKTLAKMLEKDIYEAGAATLRQALQAERRAGPLAKSRRACLCCRAERGVGE